MNYKVTSYTWPSFSVNLEKVTCQVYTWAVAYTGQVTFYKIPEKHDHVQLVTL